MVYEKIKKVALSLAITGLFILSSGIAGNSFALAGSGHGGGQYRWEHRDRREHRNWQRGRGWRSDRYRQIRARFYNGRRVAGYIDRFGRFHVVGYYDRFGRLHRY